MAPVADTVSLLKRTMDWAELEPWQQDNPSIQTGYRRVTNSWLLCFQSLSWWHNQTGTWPTCTVNIWSHLSGALAVVAAYIVLVSPRNDLDLAAIPAPFVPLHLIRMSSLPSVTKSDAMFLDLFLLGTLTCFLCSATFHSAMCHSQKVEKFMNRVDHIGIYILGSVNYFSTFHYVFFCTPHHRNLYIAAMVLSCARTQWQETSASISSRWFLVELACYVGGALTYTARSDVGQEDDQESCLGIVASDISRLLSVCRVGALCGRCGGLSILARGKRWCLLGFGWAASDMVGRGAFDQICIQRCEGESEEQALDLIQSPANADDLILLVKSPAGIS
ncbi:hemolysin-III related-domain-containing protein [Mycena pura]|uniref:Hemolysin-III related-domain-containing protein n=1 Tax=Mycena pura TaxID=153505 RepID=A0AAD6YK02_9AGAR|nr:hemolysin-III related-domain-containing protein [Mycena pura]